LIGRHLLSGVTTTFVEKINTDQRISDQVRQRPVGTEVDGG